MAPKFIAILGGCSKFTKRTWKAELNYGILPSHHGTFHLIRLNLPSIFPFQMSQVARSARHRRRGTAKRACSAAVKWTSSESDWVETVPRFSRLLAQPFEGVPSVDEGFNHPANRKIVADPWLEGWSNQKCVNVRECECWANFRSKSSI